MEMSNTQLICHLLNTPVKCRINGQSLAPIKSVLIPMPAYLTSDQISLLKNSFRRLDTQRAASLFYERLFQRNPEVRPLFPDDLSDLQLKLMSVFELVVFSFDEKKHNQYALQSSVLMPLRELGRKHDEKGIKPKHYEIANNLLVEVMHDTTGKIFTEEVKQAWQLALLHLTSAMLNTSIKPSEDVKSQSGSTFRDTFKLIIQKIKG
jgi:hemoglobin-like flavoprotein